MPWQLHLFRELSVLDNGTKSNCSNGVQWIYRMLNDCVWDAKGIASEFLGMASLVMWIIVCVPQIINNFRNTRAVEGLSFMLIFMWTIGDSANLIGAELTGQLPFQIYLAVYFVLNDLLLFGQFLFYNCWWKRKYKDYERITVVDGTVPPIVFCISGALILTIHKCIPTLVQVGVVTDVRHPAGRSLMAHNLQQSDSIFNTVKDEVGYGIGILSSACYLFSRIGQMYKNYRRKSTEGLSVMMFILAVFGNLTYGLSILVRETDRQFILAHLPWLIGSIGVIFLDFILLAQFRYYGTQDDMDTLLKQPLTSTDWDIHVPVPANHKQSVN